MQHVYTLRYESRVCALESCQANYCQDPEHPTKLEYQLTHNYTASIGTVHGHLNRWVKDHLRLAKVGARSRGATGEVEIVQAPMAAFTSYWTETERAAYKLGGLEAVKKVQQGVKAEARQAERERVKAEKLAAKQAKRSPCKDPACRIEHSIDTACDREIYTR